MRKAKTPKKAAQTSPEKVLVLRTCAANLTSYNGTFQWPERGPASCPDWDPKPRCGGGLHGLLWGAGDGSLLSWAPESKFLVVEVLASEVVAIDAAKVKFPRGEVVFCGAQRDACSYIRDRAPKGTVVHGASFEAGDSGTATAGYAGTATAGIRGTATAGDSGTATAGEGGILQLRWWDGKRYRIATFYVGEDGIEPNTPYKLDDDHKPVKVQK